MENRLAGDFDAFPADARCRQHVAIPQSVETGELQSVTNPPSESNGDFGPAVSPDGKHLAFARFRSPRTGDLYIIPLTEENSNTRREPVRITTDGADIFTPAWTPDNRALVFSFLHPVQPRNRARLVRLIRAKAAESHPPPPQTRSPSFKRLNLN